MTTGADTPEPRDRAARLLLLSPQRFPPTYADVAVLFGKRLPELGHAVDWLLQSEADCGRAYTVAWGGGTAHVGSTDNGPGFVARLRRHLLALRNDFKVFSLVRKGNYDLVVVKDKFLGGVMGLAAARLAGVPFVYWLSYPFPESFLHRARTGAARYTRLTLIRGAASRFLLYKVLLRAADHVMAQSDRMRQDLAAKGIDPAKVTPIPMGVAQAPDPSADAPPGQPDGRDGPILLYLGTLDRVRRLDFLVRVMALVAEEHPSARLRIIGKGTAPGDEEIILSEAERLGISHKVELAGFLPFAEAVEHVRRAAVCLSPYPPCFLLDSTSPTKLVEYLSLGKAVVANDHPEQRVVLEQSGGGLCVPFEEQAFARAALRLLQYPAEAEAMGRRGRDWVLAHRTYDIIGRDVHQLLQRIAGLAGDSPA